MKIEKIILRNFASIENAMNTNEISIDFSKAMNKICLIVGRNGSGKTSLLSLLHPFAGIGNLDVRDSLNLILEDKEGYKEIHISNGDDYYIIKHFYSPHKDKSHSVKSYIMKNDNELNINGNVSSFKEYVKAELGVETDHLKLIRIGSNVTSMIDLSETERKNYMSKLLDEIGIFLMYYKKVNTDLHQLKEMISHTVDKLNKLNIEDINDAKSSLKKLHSSLDMEQLKYDDITKNLSIYEHEIASINDTATLKDRLNDTGKKINKMEKILLNKDSFESEDPEFYNKKIIEMEKDLVAFQTQIDSEDITIKRTLDFLEQFYEQLRLLKVQYDKQKKSDDILQNLSEERRKITKQIAQISDDIIDFKCYYTKSEFENFFVFVKNKQVVLNKTYEFGKEIIQKIISLLREDKNVMQFINSKLMNMEENNDSDSLFLSTISKRFNFHDKDISIFDNCNNDKCEAKQLWIQIKNIFDGKIYSKEKKRDISYYKDMEYAYQNIKDVILSFGEYKSIIDILPDNIKNKFTLGSIYDSIYSLDKIYNEKDMNELYSFLSEYDDYINLLKKKKEIEDTIDKFGLDSDTTSDFIMEQIESIENQINTATEVVNSGKNTIIKLKEKVDDTTRTLESYRDLKETFEKYDLLKDEYNKLNVEYDSYIFYKKLIQEAESELLSSRHMIDSINSEIQKLVSRIDQYKSLKKELDLYNKKYDEMTLVKEALSSKKGMSLYYIKNYLGNTEDITNELLDIAYNGQIYIDNFKITPTEFTIPFYNRGKLIKDVKYASQGEISFLSIALSFGLASQTLSKYNIMLLDEIDGPLDTTNREKFIKIMENQIERIGSEQSFLITHNDMFSSYPVDVLDLNFDNQEKKYELANYIEIKRI